MTKKDINIKAIQYKDGLSYKYENKQIMVSAIENSERNDSNIYLKRLFIINSEEQREALLKIHSHETSVEMRPYSKYGIITTILAISLPSLECLHHGIGEVLKIHAKNRKKK